MKIMTKAFMVMALLFIVCESAIAQNDFNAQGSTIVPNIWTCYPNANYYYIPYFTVTNITGEEVQCRITVYDHAGNDLTQYSKIYSGGTTWGLISSGTGDFTLPAHSTRMYSLKPEGTSVWTIGHAVIEWKSNDSRLRKALVAGMTLQTSNNQGFGIALSDINNGQPF
ncbi:hypothetical protein [Maridesulfovibrio salexigens]|uniref:Uncharacterized protein n=1 Tax=Maridesulfovibrio salexigens (strain ATCC 14822 / DSM 2638 / NCIMB 8403 / VKM B-1763) TaxID=526222 RepID=C6BWD1_MARSD|nr:hypothetical protein [Maridesulfovibrio salexigens]ACS78375.1 hypothetical protein Desal_0308 [Maridesulfovibrio salexigens DSM 2638]